MSSTIALSNGQRIWMDVATGEVIDSSVTPLTSIHQDAPTVVSDGRTATLLPGRIHSHTDLAGDLWLRMPDGRERPFQLMNTSVPARPGHRLSVLWGAPVGHTEGPYFGARNHTTSKSNVNFMGAGSAGLKTWKLRPGGGLAYLTMVIACMLLGALITFIKTDSSDRAGYALVGASFGFGAAILLTPFWYAFVFLPRVKRLVGEIETFAQRLLAERDAPDFTPTDTKGSNSPHTTRGSGAVALTWSAAAVAVAALGYLAWHTLPPESPKPVDWARNTSAPVTPGGRAPVGPKGSDGLQQPPKDWATFNSRQLRRHEELMERAPSASDMDAVPPEFREAATPLAALYTLFPKGHEQPFPAVVEMLRSKGVVHAGQALSRGDLDKIMRDVGATSVHVAPTEPERVARDLESGKSAFVSDGRDLLRLTASQRDGNGRLTGFLVYDPTGRLASPVSLSTLAAVRSGMDILVSSSKAKF
jgi:hypothetical protein